MTPFCILSTLASGGGGIIAEQAGGGRLSAEKIKTLAQLVVARNRESKLSYMEGS
jgi:hypothetical protein